MVKKPIFVVQEHHASHLHWDFRLQIGKVLKSWAVPKKPPIKVGMKRLAIQVDDHKLSYAKFEGEIKEGYGKGTVKIWDNGTFDLIEKTKDKYLVDLKGKKLKGPYYIVKFPTSGPKNWLLFKKKG